MTRFEILFTVRYAVRVLERTARLWRRIDAALKVCALLAGSGAIYAVSSQSARAAMCFAAFFALAQALEFALHPAELSARALMARRPYEQILASEAGETEAALESRYHAASMGDDITVLESLRRVAYNDVVEERSDTPEAAYRLTAWQRLIGFVA